MPRLVEGIGLHGIPKRLDGKVTGSLAANGTKSWTENCQELAMTHTRGQAEETVGFEHMQTFHVPYS